MLRLTDIEILFPRKSMSRPLLLVSRMIADEFRSVLDCRVVRVFLHSTLLSATWFWIAAIVDISIVNFVGLSSDFAIRKKLFRETVKLVEFGASNFSLVTLPSILSI